MEENKGFILVRMTSQQSKSVYLLDVTLVQHTECKASTVFIVLLSVCSKRGHEHVVQNVK